MASICFGDKTIKREGNNVYFITEIGQNHQGSIEIAKAMILEAKKAGCDCVKFQKSCLPAKFTNAALKRSYASPNSWGNTYGEHKEYLEFTFDQYKCLQRFSLDSGIDFTASAMDEVSLDFLNTLDVPFIKIGSGDTNNFPMMEKVATLSRPVIISTGMQTMDTIDRVVDIMRKANKTNFALLHCVSAYPTDPVDCNLQMISLLRKRYPDIVIGYSGHETGIDITMAAILLGAKIIERHFTLDKGQKGSDHKCSLEPEELRQLTSEINALRQKYLTVRSHYDAVEILELPEFRGSKRVSLALNETSDKVILACELNCKQKLGKSIVAGRDLKGGEILRREDVCIKVSEPNGLPADEFYTIIGSRIKSNIAVDCPIRRNDIL